MICKNKRCHRDIPEDARFCPYCGKNQSPDVRRRRKRGNGEGTVYKRSDVKSTPWVALTPARMDELGRMKPEKIGSYATEQEAREALRLYQIQPTTRLSVTFKELFEEWFPIGTDGRSHQTKSSYTAAYKKMWSIKDKKFRELRTADMQRIIDFYKGDHTEIDENGVPLKNSDGTPKRRSGLSHSSLNNIVTVLGCLYTYAMQNDIVSKDYSKYVVVPPAADPKIECFTDLELKKIEKSVGKIPYADYIYIMCYTGHRVSEFLALDSLHYDSKERVFMGGNKTSAGKNKIVPVHPKIQHLVEQCIAIGGTTIFCNQENKEPFSYNDFSRVYKHALSAIGVRVLSPHATRRTFATRLDEYGVSKSDIRALMGHAGADIDDRHYIKKRVEKLRKAISKIA